MCFCVLFPDQGTDAFALDSLGNVGGLAQIEHEDGQTVVAAEGRSGGVHDGQALIQHAGEGQRVVAHSVGILVGVLVIDAVHHGGLEHGVCTDLQRAQGAGGIGGEDKADYEPEVQEKVIGPGLALAQGLGDDYEIVATVICGDNYFGENLDEATDTIVEMVKRYHPDVFVAGPAFNAGRYGVACGTICKAVEERLGIPVVSGMYKENPGADMFRQDVILVETGNSAATMRKAVPKFVNLIRKLVAGEEILGPAEEGYLERGIRVNYFADERGSERGIQMLLKKIAGLSKEGEVDEAVYAEYRRKFEDALCNDLNTSMAITVLYDLLKADCNDVTKRKLAASFDEVLSLGLFDGEKAEEKADDVDAELVSYIEAKIAERKEAKKAKDFAKADAIREELLQKGIVLEDTREGVKWKMA